jgi:hypothetical protein
MTSVVRQQAKAASSSDEESEYEEYTEEEEDDDEGPMLKPVFVRASDRVTIKEKYALGRSGARLPAWGGCSGARFTVDYHGLACNPCECRQLDLRIGVPRQQMPSLLTKCVVLVVFLS